MTELEKTNAFREVLSTICNRKDFTKNLQNVHTPFTLCNGMVEQLKSNVTLTDKIILTFNLEFVEVLCYDFEAKRENIWFITDCPQKAKIIKEYKRYAGVNVILTNYLLWENNDMKFDVIVGNPPYNKDKKFVTGPNQSLWPAFVKKSLSLLKDDGFLCLIHPCGWRKPEHELWPLMTSKQIHFLSIYSKDEGSQLFNRNAVARVDWYVLQNKECNAPTKINDQDGSDYDIMLNSLPFLPNGLIDEVISLTITCNDAPLTILYNSSYHSQREYMKDHITKTFIYPCVHSITSEGLRIIYSKIKNNGHFGVKKVIINRGDILYPYNDYEGKYGMTENSFGIIITSQKEGELIIKAVNTEKFKEIINSIKWGNNAMVDWRFFKYLKKDFWKHFVDEDGNEL